VIDEVKIWKRALSPREIKLLYEEAHQTAEIVAGTSE
jgi:hypothetical protein